MDKCIKFLINLMPKSSYISINHFIKRPIGCELFIKLINNDMLERYSNDLDKLNKLIINEFNQQGENIISQIRYCLNKEKFNPYIWIRFTQRTTNTIILNDQSKNNRNILFKNNQISLADDHATLFIGNLNKCWTNSYLFNYLINFMHELCNIILLPDKTNIYKNRGQCFLEFENHTDARVNFDKYNGQFDIDGIYVAIDWASKIPDPEGDIFNQVKSIQLGNLKDNEDQIRLKIIIEYQFGRILSIVMSKSFLPQRNQIPYNKNYCFINFQNIEDARRCHKDLSDKNICEEIIGYNCKVALANPVNKRVNLPTQIKEKRDKKILPSLNINKFNHTENAIKSQYQNTINNKHNTFSDVQIKTLTNALIQIKNNTNKLEDNYNISFDSDHKNLQQNIGFENAQRDFNKKIIKRKRYKFEDIRYESNQ